MTTDDRELVELLAAHQVSKTPTAGGVRYGCSCGARVWGESYQQHLADVIEREVIAERVRKGAEEALRSAADD